MKIVADEKIPFLKGIIEPFADIEYYPGIQINKDKIRDADALLIRTRTICNQNLLDGSNVKFIASATIGYDHIDTEYCKKKNIYWINAPGCNSGSVMQYIASALVLFAKSRNIDLRERTLGVIGVGNVGILRVRELKDRVDLFPWKEYFGKLILLRFTCPLYTKEKTLRIIW